MLDTYLHVLNTYFFINKDIIIILVLLGCFMCCLFVDYYPLAQQSYGGDIGCVPYVRTFVRMFTFCHRSSSISYCPISI